MKSIMRRHTGENWKEYVPRWMQAVAAAVIILWRRRREIFLAAHIAQAA